MAKVTVTKNVDAPVEKVFATWNDEYGDIYKFSPGLSHSRLLESSPAPSGKGALRHCDFKDGKNWLRERILDLSPNKRIVVEIFETSMPLKSAVATIDFKSTSETQSHVTFTIDFVPGMGLLGKLMVPMMKMQFKPRLQSVLDGNAAYAETGQQANATPAAAGTPGEPVGAVA